MTRDWLDVLIKLTIVILLAVIAVGVWHRDDIIVHLVPDQPTRSVTHQTPEEILT